MSKSESRPDSFGRAMAELFGMGRDEPETAPQKAPDTPRQSEPAAASVSAWEPDEEPVSEQRPAPAPAPAQQPAAPRPNPVPPPPPKPVYADEGVPPRRENTTYFAAGTVIEGTLRSDSDVEIVGDFSGEIMSDGKVTIHANTVSSIAAKDLQLIGSTLTGDVAVSGGVVLDQLSSIQGNIRAGMLESSGKIQGNLAVQESVELKGRAVVIGDIKTPLLSMGTGVRYSGRLDMGAQAQEKKRRR
ncbi:MAG: hypothetical protein E7474_08775 [Ruminococcaceae bacterium]|nr:hypothetical protein [Oscillospiraceae bacterium]